MISIPVVGDAAIVVDAETGPFDHKLRSEVTKSASGVGTIIKGVLGAAIVQAGARAGADFIKSAIGGASDLNESLSKVQVVFGDSSAAVRQFASNAATAMGQTKQQALEAAGTFGNLAVSIGLPQKQAAEMSTKLVGLASDLASFNNTPVDEALQALRSGLTGETEPLKRFGVALNDATLRQKALELGLIKSTKDALEPAVKAQATYALILDRTKTAQGDFARTSGGLANQQKILSARIADLKTGLGQFLLPIMTKITSIIIEKVLPAFSSLSTGLAPVIATVKNLVDNLLAGFQGGESEFVAGFAESFYNLGETLKELYENVVKPFVAFLQDNFRNVLIGLGAAVILFGSPLIALGLAFAAAYAKSETFRDIVQGAIASVTTTIAGIVAFVQENLPKFQEAFEHVANAVVAVWNQLSGTIIPVVTAIVNTVVAVFGRIIDVVKQVVLFVVNIINGDFGAAFGNLKNIVANVIGAVLDVIKGLVPSIAGLVVGVVSAMTSLAGDIIKGLVRGIKDKAGDVITAIKKYVLDKVPSFVRKFFGMNSPSKMFAGFGQNLMEGLAQGIRGSAGSPLDALAAVNARLGNGTTAGTGTAVPGSAAAPGVARTQAGVSFRDIVVHQVENNPEATAFAVMSKVAAGLNL